MNASIDPEKRQIDKARRAVSDRRVIRLFDRLIILQEWKDNRGKTEAIRSKVESFETKVFFLLCHSSKSHPYPYHNKPHSVQLLRGD